MLKTLTTDQVENIENFVSPCNNKQEGPRFESSQSICCSACLCLAIQYIILVDSRQISSDAANARPDYSSLFGLDGEQ